MFDVRFKYKFRISNFSLEKIKSCNQKMKENNKILKKQKTKQNYKHQLKKECIVKTNQQNF